MNKFFSESTRSRTVESHQSSMGLEFNKKCNKIYRFHFEENEDSIVVTPTLHSFSGQVGKKDKKKMQKYFKDHFENGAALILYKKRNILKINSLIIDEAVLAFFLKQTNKDSQIFIDNIEII